MTRPLDACDVRARTASGCAARAPRRSRRDDPCGCTGSIDTGFTILCGISAFRRYVRRASWTGTRVSDVFSISSVESKRAEKRGAVATFHVLLVVAHTDGEDRSTVQERVEEARTCRAAVSSTDRTPLLMCAFATCRVVVFCLFWIVVVFALVGSILLPSEFISIVCQIESQDMHVKHVMCDLCDGHDVMYIYIYIYLYLYHAHCVCYASHACL